MAKVLAVVERLYVLVDDPHSPNVGAIVRVCPECGNPGKFDRRRMCNRCRYQQRKLADYLKEKGK